MRLSQPSFQINYLPEKNVRGRVRQKTTLLSVGQLEEVAKRLPGAKDKKPEDFISMRSLKELDKEGFFNELYPKG